MDRDRGPGAAGVPDALVLTGERTLPGILEENYWFQRHVVAYDLAAPLVAGREVLDAGCGEGYGLALLAAAGATGVAGVDLDETVVAHVERTYAAADARIEVVAAELLSLPWDDDRFDVVVSFQVIEHLYDVPGYLRSLRRVLRPGGTVLIATPNRLTFTPGSDTPVNPFHVREFTAAELTVELQAAGFAVDRVLGVHHGRRLRLLERLTRRTVPDLLAARPPGEWSRPLRRLVAAVRPSWFTVRSDRLDASLDLVAVARAPVAASP